MIVGISGQAGAGKDTTGQCVVQERPGSKTLALADPLKRFCQTVFEFTDEQLWGPSEKRNAPDPRFSSLRSKARARVHLNFLAGRIDWLHEVLPQSYSLTNALPALQDWLSDVLAQETITPRYALQTLGTEFGRAVHEDIWITYGLRKARELEDRGAPVVAITDVRFINEARLIQDYDGEVWRVVRDGAAGSVGKPGHASEAEQQSDEMVKYIDHTITNNEEVAALSREVSRLLAVRGVR